MSARLSCFCGKQFDALGEIADKPITCPECGAMVFHSDQQKRPPASLKGEEKNRRCPVCTAMIPAEAVRCGFCGFPKESPPRPSGTEAPRRPRWPWVVGLGMATLLLVSSLAILASKVGQLPPSPTGTDSPSTNPRGSDAGANGSNSPWRVTVLEARRNPERWVVITAQFEVTKGEAGSLEDRVKPGRGILPDEAMAWLLDNGTVGSNELVSLSLPGKDVLAKPSKLFLSDRVELELADGRRIRPESTSFFGYVLAFSPHGRAVKLGFVAKDPSAVKDADVPRVYITTEMTRSGKRFSTAALVQQGRKVTINLRYAAPAGTKAGKLRFYDCPPVEVAIVE